MRRGAVVALGLLFSSTAPAQARTITILPSTNDLTIHAGIFTPDVVSRAPAVPLVATDTAVDLGATTVVDYDWSDAMLETSVDITLTPEGLAVRGLAYTKEPIAANEGIRFSVDEDTSYILEGALSASGVLLDVVSLRSTLRDETTGQDLLVSLQDSTAVGSTSFVLGGAAGNSNNISTGSLTGVLPANHDIRFSYEMLTAATDIDASASGFVRLRFVPEPSTALLLGSGFAGIALGRRSRRRRPGVDR